MNTKKRALFRALAALFAVLLAAGVAGPVAAFAAEDGVWLATTNTHYLNPDTGVTDDGGSKNAAIGEGMCRSVIYEKALVEIENGKVYVTVRVQLVSNMGAIKFTVQQKAGDPASYASVSPRVVAEDAGADTADYRFAVPAANSYIGCSTYVTPMGRDVKFYMNLSGDLTAGSGDFVVSVKPAAQGTRTEPATDASQGQAATSVGQGQAGAGGTAAAGTGQSQTGANGTAGAGQAQTPAVGAESETNPAQAAEAPAESAENTPQSGSPDETTRTDEPAAGETPEDATDAEVDATGAESVSAENETSDTDAETDANADGGAIGNAAGEANATGGDTDEGGDGEVAVSEDTGEASASGGFPPVVAIVAAILIVAGIAAAVVLRKSRKKQ